MRWLFLVLLACLAGCANTQDVKPVSEQAVIEAGDLARCERRAMAELAASAARAGRICRCILVGVAQSLTPRERGILADGQQLMAWQRSQAISETVAIAEKMDAVKNRCLAEQSS